MSPYTCTGLYEHTLDFFSKSRTGPYNPVHCTGMSRVLHFIAILAPLDFLNPKIKQLCHTKNKKLRIGLYLQHNNFDFPNHKILNENSLKYIVKTNLKGSRII